MKDNIAPQKDNLFFDLLEEINTRPEPFACYTADELWTHEHTSEKMLQYHLDGEVDVSSRRKEFIDASVEWIITKFNISCHSRIADFGCGPGLYARHLAHKGAQVTGIDFSVRSINYAKEAAKIEGIKIHYIHKNYFDWDPEEKFDLIMMIMCDYTALSPEQRSVLLKKFRNMLNPGGSVLLDVYSFSAFSKRKEESCYGLNLMDGFWAREKYYGFLNTYRYEREKVVLDKYTILTVGRTRTIYNWFQYFGPDELKQEFASNGLCIVEYYADVSGKVYSREYDEFAVIATAQ